MELCIKTLTIKSNNCHLPLVSILVLMELCIKTINCQQLTIVRLSFNPCFNGTMYKNILLRGNRINLTRCFNPCFNGTMYKNINQKVMKKYLLRCFNPCFNGTMYKNLTIINLTPHIVKRFNPCFNGTMYKNYINGEFVSINGLVSILVLMELCIKTEGNPIVELNRRMFQSLF